MARSIAANAAAALFALGRWDEALSMVATSGSDDVFALDGALIAGRIALWRGQIDDAVGHSRRAGGGEHDVSQPKALIFAAEVAAHQRSFAEARRLAATTFEAIVTTEDAYLVAFVGATAVGIEADRVELARLTGRRADADVDAARAVADELINRTGEMIGRVVAADIALLPDTTAWLTVVEAHQARAHGDSNAEQWADIAARFDALANP